MKYYRNYNKVGPVFAFMCNLIYGTIGAVVLAVLLSGMLMSLCSPKPV